MTKLISDKEDFKSRKVKRSYYIIIEGSIHQDDITITDTHAPNIAAFKCTKQIVIELKGENYTKTVIVEDYKTPLSTMDRSSRKKINREILDLNTTD